MASVEGELSTKTFQLQDEQLTADQLMQSILCEMYENDNAELTLTLVLSEAGTANSTTVEYQVKLVSINGEKVEA